MYDEGDRGACLFPWTFLETKHTLHALRHSDERGAVYHSLSVKATEVLALFIIFRIASVPDARSNQADLF